MKYIILAFLVFILYRMIVKPDKLNAPRKKEPLQEPDSDEYTDYEELD